MEEFIQQLLNGLSIGGIYALIALGYTMVYGILRLINFAHGDLFTIGAYCGFSLLAANIFSSNLNFIFSVVIIFLLAAGLVGLVGVILERIAYRPLRKANRLAAVVSALGASVFFQNALMLFYGARPEVYPVTSLNSISLNFLGANISATKVLVILFSFALMFLLTWFINKTKTGAAIRAVAIDQVAAELMGINVNKIISLVFFIGPALGSIAGIMTGFSYGQITYDMGVMYGLKAFIAAIFGGIGNIPGAMIGGILLGVIESLGAAYLTSAWKDAIAFVVLILVLLFRPTGLLGERVADKV